MSFFIGLSGYILNKQKKMLGEKRMVYEHLFPAPRSHMNPKKLQAHTLPKGCKGSLSVWPPPDMAEYTRHAKAINLGMKYKILSPVAKDWEGCSQVALLPQHRVALCRRRGLPKHIDKVKVIQVRINLDVKWNHCSWLNRHWRKLNNLY